MLGISSSVVAVFTCIVTLVSVKGTIDGATDERRPEDDEVIDFDLAWEIMQMSILRQHQLSRIGGVPALFPVHFSDEQVGVVTPVSSKAEGNPFLNLVFLLAKSKMVAPAAPGSKSSAMAMVLNLCCRFYKVALKRTQEPLTHEELAVAICASAIKGSGSDTGADQDTANFAAASVRKSDHRLFACYTSRICMSKFVLEPFLRAQSPETAPATGFLYDRKLLAEAALLQVFKPLLSEGKSKYLGSSGSSNKIIIDVFQVVAPMFSSATTTQADEDGFGDNFSNDDDSEDEKDFFSEDVTQFSVQTIGRKYLQDLGRMRAEQISTASPVEAAELAFKMEILASCYGKGAVIGEMEIASLFSFCAFVKCLLAEFNTKTAETTAGGVAATPVGASATYAACGTALQSFLIDRKVVSALKKLMKICVMHISDVLSENEWAMIQAFATFDWLTPKQEHSNGSLESSSLSVVATTAVASLQNLDYDSLFGSIDLLEELKRHNRVQSTPATGLANVLQLHVQILKLLADDVGKDEDSSCAVVDAHCFNLIHRKLSNFLPDILPGVAALPGAGENLAVLYELLLSSSSTHVQLSAFYLLRAGVHHGGSGEKGLYTHSDGHTETATVMKRMTDAEGGGYTIFVPSLGRERLTTEERFVPGSVLPLDGGGEPLAGGESETNIIVKRMLPQAFLPMLPKLVQLCAPATEQEAASRDLAHRDNAILVVWLLFLEYVEKANAEKSADSVLPRAALGNFARENGFGFSVLHHCFTLIEDMAGSKESDKAVQTAIADHLAAQVKLSERGGQSYMQLLPFTTGEHAPSNHGRLTLLASYVFFKTVRSLPALVRAWWNDHCGSAQRAVVRDYMQKNLSTFIIRAEIQEINQGAKDGLWDANEVSIKGSSVSREVTAALEHDDCKLEIVVELPQAYPLSDVKVRCTKKVGIPEKRWRLWELQVKKLLRSEDGSVLDVVLMWKCNVEKEFEGKEPCLICFSILDPKTNGTSQFHVLTTAFVIAANSNPNTTTLSIVITKIIPVSLPTAISIAISI
jgi:hypothetical protein